jgi:hypothetical protein
LTLCANIGEEALMILHVDEIEAKLKSQPYLSLSEIKKNVSAEVSGFYWVYSNLPIESFKTATAHTNAAHVNFMALSKSHEGLKHAIQPSNTDYWCICNEKGSN